MKLAELQALRNKLQPTGGSNSDVPQFDYKFWKETESIAKKQKEKSLELVKSLSATPDQAGTILRGQRFSTTLKVSEPVKAFDLELYIAKLVEKYPQDRLFFREAAIASRVDSYTRSTYTVEENDD